MPLDDLQRSIVRFVSSISLHITIGYMAPWSLIVSNVRTDGRTDGQTIFTHVNSSSSNSTYV